MAQKPIQLLLSSYFVRVRKEVFNDNELLKQNQYEIFEVNLHLHGEDGGLRHCIGGAMPCPVGGGC